MAPEGNTATGHRRRRVLVFPLPYQGHMNPMFRLAGLLHARGFAVTVFHTDSNAPDPSSHPEYDFIAVPDGMAAAKQEAVKVIEHVLALNRICEEPFRERLAALLAAPGARDDVACLVADLFLLTLMNVARQQGMPTLALRTGSAASFLCFVAHPMLCDKGYLPPQESQLDALVKELPPYRVRDLMSARTGGHEHDISCELLSRAVAAVRTSSGLILNTFDALEAADLAAIRRDLAPPVFDIGPLHKASAASSSLLRQDHGCLEWLNSQAPASVLYVSFDSLASVGSADFAEAAWGIAHSGQPFLWVLRPDLVRGATRAALPDGFDAATRGRGMVVSWAPQVEVLAHAAVGGFWTHCGWNSTLESVCAGVPMLCRPCFGDQMGNARHVEHVWRAGLTLQGELERVNVGATIRRLMQSQDGQEMRRRAGEFKNRAAESMTRGGPSSINIDKLVFKNKTGDLDKDYPELVDPAKLILKRCNGLPLAVVTIRGFLADQPSKTAVEWRKLNEHIGAELEMNPRLEPIKTVLMKSYDGLPYYLKACFLYLSIFPEDHKISLRRLVRRWIAEGYSRAVRDKSAAEIAERYFVELIERSMILPTQESVSSRKGIDSCQLHDLIPDISISKSMEENLVLRLEGGCSSNTHGAVRHLAISGNWEGDEMEFQSTLELSRIRSLTVFGKWRPFYISAKMRFLRVLDLEGTEDLANRDLEHIGTSSSTIPFTKIHQRFSRRMHGVNHMQCHSLMNRLGSTLCCII